MPTLDIFDAFDIQQYPEPLYDYGKLYASTPAYPVIFPSGPEAVQEIARLAYTHDFTLRVRGSGHTFNGASLPQKDEILIRTDDLDTFCFETAGTLTAGTGALVWDVRDLARDHGFDLPVYNGGWAGPTLGGYLNAGGFGKSGLSEVYGGLWEVVEEVRLIDGQGHKHIVNREHPLFPWLFGSYGQLGLITEVKLKLIPLHEGKTSTYPLGLSGKIPKRQEADPKLNDLPPFGKTQTNLFWFSLLVSPLDEAQAWQDMLGLVKAHPEYLIPDGGWTGPVLNGAPIGYQYVIQFHNFNPPLLYEKPETFLVMGVMCLLATGDDVSNLRVLQVERDFIALSQNGNYKLYLQAENFGRNIHFQTYYGDKIYGAFRDWKNKLDPKHIINPGIVFLGH